MKSGDKVRLIHEHQQGVVIRWVDKQQLEIQLDSGFEIVLNKSLVVAVDKREEIFEGNAKSFESEIQPRKEEKKQQLIAIRGIFLGLTQPENSGLSDLFWINNTDLKCYLTFYERRFNTWQLVKNLAVEARQFVALETEIKNNEMHFRGQMAVHALLFHSEYKGKFNPLELEFHLKQFAAFKLDKSMPLCQLAGKTWQLDAENLVIDTAILKEKMLEPKVIPNAKPIVPNMLKQNVIDLHADKLFPAHAQPKPEEILGLQLKAFQNMLEKAIASNFEDVIFIHGVGNGILKQKIRGELARNKYVKLYNDAEEKDFGQGATRVWLR